MADLNIKGVDIMKKYISLILVVLVALCCFASCKNSNSNVENFNGETKQNESLDNSSFVSAYSERLKQMGMVKHEQKGVIISSEGVWLEPSGLIANARADFDNDGNDEMLVVYTKENSTADDYSIYMDMYEDQNGSVSVADTMKFVSYHGDEEDEFSGVHLKKSQTSEVFANLQIIETDGVYLLCENRMSESVLGNGQTQDIWLVEYKDNKFKYKASFTQTSGGTSGFEYTGYNFVNGELDDAFVYYNEWYNQQPNVENKPLYTSFGEALSEFLKTVSLRADDDVNYANNPFEQNIDFFDSFVEQEGRKVFALKNEIEKRGYSKKLGGSTVRFEFEIEKD